MEGMGMWGEGREGRWLECVGGPAHGRWFYMKNPGAILHVPAHCQFGFDKSRADESMAITEDVYRVMNIQYRGVSIVCLAHESVSVHDVIQRLRYKKTNEVEHAGR